MRQKTRANLPLHPLLPTDVTGASIFNQKKSEFEFRPGPIFAQIVLAVLDEGPGFQHSLIARRQRSGQSSSLGSSGLGLAIASRIVALHGTELEVRARLDGGSCVQFVLSQKNR